MAFQDLVSQALGGTVEVLAAKYGARAGGTAAAQDAGLSAVDRPSDVQAKAGSYTIPGTGISVGWVALAAVAVVAVVLIARR